MPKTILFVTSLICEILYYTYLIQELEHSRARIMWSSYF